MTTTKANRRELKAAIRRSREYNEIASVEYAGTIDDLRADLIDICPGHDIDDVLIDPRVVDTWGCEEDSEDMDWRLYVTLVDADAE